MAIQVKRGTEAKRKASSLVLDSGQPLWESDTNKLYVGDGTTQAKSLKPVVAEELSCTPDYDVWPYGAYKITTDGAIRIKSEGSNAGVFVDYMGVDIKNRNGESLSMSDVIGLNTSTDTLTTNQSKGFKITDSTNTRYIIPDTSSSPASNDSNLLITKDDICKTQNTYTKPQVHNEEIYVGTNDVSSGIIGHEKGVHIKKEALIQILGGDATNSLTISSAATTPQIYSSVGLTIDTASSSYLKLQSINAGPTVVTVKATDLTSSSSIAIAGEQFTIVPKTRNNNEMISIGFNSAGVDEAYPIIRYNNSLGSNITLHFPDGLASNTDTQIATVDDTSIYEHYVELNYYDSSLVKNIRAYFVLRNYEPISTYNAYSVLTNYLYEDYVITKSGINTSLKIPAYGFIEGLGTVNYILSGSKTRMYVIYTDLEGKSKTLTLPYSSSSSVPTVMDTVRKVSKW